MVSSLNYGLFVLRPDYEAISAIPAKDFNYGEQVRTRAVLYREEDADCPDFVETKQCKDSCGRLM